MTSLRPSITERRYGWDFAGQTGEYALPHILCACDTWSKLGRAGKPKPGVTNDAGLFDWFCGSVAETE